MRRSKPFCLTMSVSIILHLGMIITALLSLSGHTTLNTVASPSRSQVILVSSPLTPADSPPIVENTDKREPKANKQPVLSASAERKADLDTKKVLAPVAKTELVSDIQPKAQSVAVEVPNLTQSLTANIDLPEQEAEDLLATELPLNPEQQFNKASGDEDELLRHYMQQVQAALESQKFYPNRLRKMRKEGWVELSFTLDRSGSIQSERVARFDGHASFQQAALAALEKVGQFPGFPEEIDRSMWAFNITLQYTLN